MSDPVTKTAGKIAADSKTGTKPDGGGRIVLLMRHVRRDPSAGAVIDLDAETADFRLPDNVDSAIDELAQEVANKRLVGSERAALGVALRLRDELGGTLTALAVGHGPDEQGLLAAALRAGCDRAVCLVDSDETDTASGDAESIDEDGEENPAEASTHDMPAIKLDQLDGGPLSGFGYLVLAETLAAALRHLGCDLFLCADRSDEPHGMVGPAIAELMAMPHLSAVVDARVEPGSEAGKRARVVAKHRSGNEHHRFRCRLPLALCVLTCEREDEPSLRTGEAAAAQPAVERLALGGLGIENHSWRDSAQVPLQLARSERKAAVIVGVRDLVTRLVDDQLLP